LKDKYGLAAYTIAAFKAMDTSQQVAYTLNLDGEQFDVDGVGCRVDNSSNIGVPGVSVNPSTDVSDGYFDVLIWQEIDLSFSSVTDRMRNKDTSDDLYHHWQAKEITISTDQPQPIQGDGEVWGNTPISIKVLPGAMRVLVPK
jgi:diacylglycerol kinase family enzyme